MTGNAPSGRSVPDLPSFVATHRTPLTHGLVAGLWVSSALWVWLLTVAQGPRGPEGIWVGVDSYAYWYAFEHSLYGYDDVVTPGALTGRYLYSPAFAQLVWPLTHLPWPVFAWLWSLAMAAVFWWLLRPLAWRWRVPAFVFLCLEEVILGNVRALIAASLVLALRRPAFWALPLLTKVASGVGVLWHPLRGEWRRFAVALGCGAAVVAASALLEPALWSDWVAFLRQQPTTDGYLLTGLRVLVAIGVVVFAARTGRAEWLAPATALASPVIYLADLSLLAAMPRLRLERPDHLGPEPTTSDPPAERPASRHG